MLFFKVEKVEIPFNNLNLIKKMLVPFDPFKKLDSFFEEDELFSKMHKMARMNIEERDKDIVVEMEIPGVEADDIDVTLEENILKVRAGRKEEKEEGGDKKYHRREFRRHYFKRIARLPAKVKANQAQANYKNGVLSLKIPKSEEEKRKEVKIEVNE